MGEKLEPQLFEGWAFGPGYFSQIALLSEIAIWFASSSKLAELLGEITLMSLNLQQHHLAMELCGVGMAVGKRSMKRVVCKLAVEAS